MTTDWKHLESNPQHSDCKNAALATECLLCGETLPKLIDNFITYPNSSLEISTEHNIFSSIQKSHTTLLSYMVIITVMSYFMYYIISVHRTYCKKTTLSYVLAYIYIDMI